MMYACCLLSAAVFITANGAIAKQCYDDNGDYAKKHDSNNKFVLSNIIVGPICILCALGAIFLAVRAPSMPRFAGRFPMTAGHLGMS